jgi:hypothetical protein
VREPVRESQDRTFVRCLQPGSSAIWPLALQQAEAGRAAQEEAREGAQVPVLPALAPQEEAMTGAAPIMEEMSQRDRIMEVAARLTASVPFAERMLRADDASRHEIIKRVIVPVAQALVEEVEALELEEDS